MSAEQSPEAEAENIQAQKASSYNLIREFIIVIIAALIALAADDYQEQSERAERDQQVLIMIKNELEANLNKIKASGTYHDDMLLKVSESERLMAEENRFVMPEGWQDTQQIEAISAAYELALINGTLARLSPQTGLTIASLYDDLERFDQRRQQLNLATIQSSFRDGVRFFILKRVAMQIELEYKKTMIPLFEKTLAAVNSEIAQ